MICNYTDLIGKNIIDDIKRHDYDYEIDNSGVVIGENIQHKSAAYKVVRINNDFVECRLAEGIGEETITLPLAEVKQQIDNYYE